MQPIDYIVILLFSGIVVAAGLSFGRSGKDMTSYFAAGGAMPWPISGLSLFMSFFSAGTFVVWGSIAYDYGFVAIMIQWTMCLGGFAVGAFIAPKWRKTGALTAAEFIRQRLGKKTQQFYTYLILFLSLAYAGAFLYPVAKIINVSTGFSITGSVIVLGLLIMVYTTVGGLWAVVITDVLQFIILTAAVLMVVPLAFEVVGGWNGFVDNVPSTFFTPVQGEYSWLFLGAFAMYNSIFIGGNWAYVQRYTSVKNPKDARKVGYLFAGLYVVSPLIWMLPPMLYRALNPDLAGLENEGAYLLMCKQVLPGGMLGLMLGGMVFATASSVNTTLNLSAAVFTNDIYKQLRSQVTDQQVMRMAKISTFLFGIGTIFVAMLVPAAGGIVEVVLSVGAVTGCSLYGPPIWALFSKWHTGKSILACTLTSLGINLFFKFISPWLLDLQLDRAEEMLLGCITPFVLLLAYDMWARYKQRQSPDFLLYQEITTHAPKTSKQVEVQDRQNEYGWKVLSYTMGAVGLLVIGLGIIAQKATLLVIIMGVTIVLLAVLLYRRRDYLKKKRSAAKSKIQNTIHQ